MPIEATTFCFSTGVSTADMERKRTDITFQLSRLVSDRGLTLVSPAIQVLLGVEDAKNKHMI